MQIVFGDLVAHVSSPWSTYLAPGIVATVAGLLIALWNRRKAPHERLAALLSIYENWPRGTAGRFALKRPIAVLIERVRLREGIPALVAATGDERAVQLEAATIERRERLIRWAMIVGVIGAVFLTLVTFSRNSGPVVISPKGAELHIKMGTPDIFTSPPSSPPATITVRPSG